MLALALGAVLVAVARWLPASRGGTVEFIAGVLERDAPGFGPDARHRVAHALVDAGERFDVDPLLLLALIDVESDYDPDARGRRGGRGLMQLRPVTALDVAERHGIAGPEDVDLRDPAVNVRLGTAYLAELREQFGDWTLALAAYNSGPTRVRRTLARGGDAPRRYAERVLARWNELRDELGGGDPARSAKSPS